MPTLRQLEYFVRLAEAGNFRGAAKLAGVTQATLSAQIRELENKLGVVLAERNRRAKVLLTPAGLDVLGRARVIIGEVRDLVDSANQQKSLLGGTLRLGLLPSLGPYLLPLILPGLKTEFPGLNLYLRENTAAQLLEQISEARLDALIFPLEDIDHAHFDHAPLFQEPLRAAIPLTHRLAGCEKIAPDQLRGEAVLTLEHGHSMHHQVLQLCAENGAVPIHDFASTSLDTLFHMAGMGNGIAILPALYLVAEAAKSPLVSISRIGRNEPTRRFALVWRRFDPHRTEMRQFATCLRRIALTAGETALTPIEV